MMEGGQGQGIERRVERAVFETDRYVVVGDVTLPPEGYQSRFSDSLNRGDLSFIPLVNVEMTPLGGGPVQTKPFVVLAKAHVRVAFPLE
jgi:uncharacterized protein DUF6812